MDIIPSDLATYGGDAKDLLRDLQSRNERMFLLTLLVVNLADNKQQLDNQIFQTAGVAQKANCSLVRLDYQQEAGLVSSLPLGLNEIPIQRGLTTSSTAIFVPFTTQELFQNGEALYYGLNALSNNMILADRKKLKNPKGVYRKGTGTPRKQQAVSPTMSMSVPATATTPEAAPVTISASALWKVWCWKPYGGSADMYGKTRRSLSSVSVKNRSYSRRRR